MNSTDLKVICLESEAFYALIDIVVNKLSDSTKREKQEAWINDTQAMELLKISSKTTLQKYRDEGKIRYSQIGKKVILYYRDSILQLIEANANK